MAIGDLFCTSPPEPKIGAFTDRFGVSTRVEYLPDAYIAYSGKVGALDGSDNIPIHAQAEYDCLYQALDEAKGHATFAVTELGAGWGPWLVLSAVTARRRGMKPILTGLEGSTKHFSFMRSHFADNGLDIAEHRIEHAVVGTYDGVARFPVAEGASGDWGSQANFNEKSQRRFLFWKRKPSTEGAMEEVPCISLRSLLQQSVVQDVVHCDVQGAEADVFESAMDLVDQKVKRVCIGTHGRSIEERLMKLFSEHGWHSEADIACRFHQDPITKQLELVNDGEQIWKNPAF